MLLSLVYLSIAIKRKIRYRFLIIIGFIPIIIFLNYSDAFDAWKLLYYISKSTQSDKDQALQNMKRLDPLHPNVLDRPQ